MKAVFLSRGNASFPDSQTGELVNLTEVHYIPKEGDFADTTMTAFTRLDVPQIAPGKLCEMYFETSKKSNKDKLVGIIPLASSSAIPSAIPEAS